MSIVLVGDCDPTGRAAQANRRARLKLELLRAEPDKLEGVVGHGDAYAVGAHWRMFPAYPLPLSGGMVRIANTKREEYISSAAFSDAKALPHVWGQSHGLGMALQILTARFGTFTCALSKKIAGRWYPNEGIVTAYRHGGRFKTDSGSWTNDWTDIGHSCKDISKRVLKCLDDAGYHFRKAKPSVFRQMIYTHRKPQTDDFAWLTIGDLWALREQCKRMKTGTWSCMRRWLMRRHLSLAARRALGGRPGRLLQNQQRTKDNREYRRVRTNRNKGGSNATARVSK